MKKLSILLSLFALSGIESFARYESVESEKEFIKRIDDFDFSLVCFADSTSGQGKIIIDAMNYLSDLDMFSDELRHRVGFLFVHAEDDSAKKLIQKYGYQGRPLFIIFEGGDEIKVAESLLSVPYTRQKIKNFVVQSIGQALEEIREDVAQQRSMNNRKQPGSFPRIRVGLSTNYYPGYGYYRAGRPYWWHRRYRNYYPDSRLAGYRREPFHVGYYHRRG
ncbi:MAG: hypothetical protein CL947_02640 [Epsilonproteobacteria bacterium]|nr:hypothetical protein [Campylobacterota bacterium]|tara:strand:+ start:862 stop:1521 length:660 start_codon:yes stop_codon:yes gene_type:complete